MENIKAVPRIEEVLEPVNRKVITDAPSHPVDIKDEDIPVSLYEQRFHHPYIADLLGMKNSLLLSLDKESSGKLKAIDQFLMEQMEKSDLEDSKENYEEVLNRFMAVLGMDKSVKLSKKLERLSTVVLLRKLFK